MRTALFVLAAAAAPLAAQSGKDMRDVVITTTGKEVRGRVVQRFDPAELLVVQGGKRVRIPRSKVKSVTTVTDRLREFLDRRLETRGNLQEEWMLTEWAASNSLDKMARLQARHVVEQNPDHEDAHRFLGHRQRKGVWLWPVGSGWRTLEGHEEYTAKWGHPLVLEGEHFTVRTNAGARRGLDTLFDLERLYVWWFDTFGEALRPREVLVEMHFHAYNSIDEFPPFTSNRIPYYFPRPNGDVAHSFFETAAQSPELLFQLGTEQLIYNSLADGMPVPSSPKDRIAAWIEIGLGQWVESLFTGDAGYAEPAKPALDRNQAADVLQWRPYGLENMLGIRYSRFYDVSRQTRMHWSNVSTFVAFLMDPAKSEKTRPAFLGYLDLVYNDGKGNSSSLFDKQMGTVIEALEKPWVDWLQQKTGIRATRKR